MLTVDAGLMPMLLLPLVLLLMLLLMMGTMTESHVYAMSNMSNRDYR